MAQDENDLKRIFHLVSAAKYQNGDSNTIATADGQQHHDTQNEAITSEEELMKALQLSGRSPTSSGDYWKEDAGQISFGNCFEY